MTEFRRGANEHFGQRFYPRFVEWVEVFDLDNDCKMTLRPLQPLEKEATIWCPSDHGRSIACGWIADTVILQPMEPVSTETAVFAEEGADNGDDVEDEDLSGLADLSKLFETVERRREKRGATPHLNRDPPVQLPSPARSSLWVKRVSGGAEAETPAP